MSTNHRHLVDHRFGGGRFDDHGIDLDVLPELLHYKRLLVEVAKELWRRHNRDRERLPRNFEESLALRFYEVQPNCATIPLERAFAADENVHLWRPENELEEAVSLVTATIEAANKDQALPDAFPKHLMYLFADYGKSLQQDEWMEHRLPQRKEFVRFDAVTRDRLTRRRSASYHDSIDVVGEVTMARISRPRMALRLSSGREVEAAFRAEDEDTITTALKQHCTARLRVVGLAQHSPDGQIERIVEVHHVSLLAGGAVQFEASVKPIWEEFADVLAQLPAEDLSTLPADGAERHDFYLDGQLGGRE